MPFGELAVAGIVLAILAVALFLSHITHGGLYSDDWESVSLARFDTHGLFNILLPSWTNPGNRPLHNLDYSIVLALLGDHQHAFLAYTALITVAVSLALYAVLRTLSIERLHAIVIAGLVMVYPFADSTHLWFSATDSDGTIVLYLLGVFIAIRGLRRSSRTAVAYHAAALSLFACSIMLYETTASVIMLTGFLYWWLAGRSAAFPRWLSDISCTLLLLFLFARNSTIPRVSGISAITQHARTIYDQSLTLLARTVVPINIDRAPILAGIALVLVGGLIAHWHLPSDDPARLSLKRWLPFTFGGLVFAMAAVTMFIPSNAYYVPLQEGVGNRVNGVPALGFVCTAYGTYMVLGILCALALRTSQRDAIFISRKPIGPGITVVVGIVLALLVGVRWAELTRSDVLAWNLASRYQLQILDRIHALTPRLPHHDVLLAFGGPAYTRPGVPVFAASWDLNGAIQLLYNDFSLAADPIVSGDSLTCTASSVALSVGGGPPSALPYSEVVLLDVTTGSVSRPTTQSQCKAVLPMLVPGPFTVLPPAAV
jgi:hypothetical protein